MAMSDKKQTILDELKLHIAKSNTAIAHIIKNKYPELFDGVETETIRKRIGELRSDFDLYPTEEQMQSEEEQVQQKVIIKDTDIEIDKDVWLKKEYENTNLKSTISEKDKIIKVLRNELFEKSEKLDYVLDLKNYNPQKFKITANPEIKSESTAILCASDWHIEERIDLSTVNGLNEFNLEIAKESANNFFARGVRLIEVFGKDTDINDVVLWLGGDFISGYIHEELMESNYLTPIEATMVVMDMLSNGINYILKNTKCRLTIPTSVGNHCLEENTEILTELGWKRMAELTEDDIIASFKKETGEISFDKVVALTKFSEHGAYHFTSNFKDEIVTKDHNLVIDGNFVKACDYEEVKTSNFRHFGELTTNIDYNILSINDMQNEDQIHAADKFQIWCITHGKGCKISYSDDGSVDMHVVDIKSDFNGIWDTIVKREYLDETFNFVGVTSVNGTIIVRRNGIVSFTGNSRNSEKRKISTENKNSYEYLMYHMLRRQFEGNDRVNFIIEDGYLTYVDVYDYKIRFHHGHALNYNGGVGGLTIPTAKAIAQWDKETKAYLDIFGHFHTLMMDTGTAKFVVNGSLVGYSPFALRIKPPYEAPKQAFVLIDKNRGKTISAPIFVR